MKQTYNHDGFVWAAWGERRVTHERGRVLSHISHSLTVESLISRFTLETLFSPQVM